MPELKAMRQTHTTLESAFGNKAVSGIFGLGNSGGGGGGSFLQLGNSNSGTSPAAIANSSAPLTLANVASGGGTPSQAGGFGSSARSGRGKSLFDEPNPGSE